MFTHCGSMSEQEFLSIKEVAAIFAVNTITIRRAIKRGHLIAIRIGNSPKSPYRISRKSIDAIHENLLNILFKKG